MLSTKTRYTSHGEISVVESSGTGLPVVMIHGNSSCKEVFARQLESPLADKYRMIAFDLPGHGASQDAVDPARTYSMPGYADVTLEVMRELDVNQAAVFGWSVGGHIGLELLPRFPGLEGLMIAATPPLHPTPESFQGGFKPHPMLAVLSKPELTDEEVDLFVAGAYGEGATKQLRDAVRRTDGRSRAMLFGSIFDGRTADQRQLAETTKVPLAIVNGANDPMTNTDYIGSLHYASLWEKHCFVLRGEGHAPFLTNPQAFNPIFDRFLADVSKLAARRPGSANLRAVV